MATHRAIVVVVGVLLWTGALGARQTPSPRSQSRSTAVSANAASSVKDAPSSTLMDIMTKMIDPASKVVFGAVTTVETATGVKEKAPTSDREWAEVLQSARAMVDGADLLLVPGRKIAPARLAKVHADGELAPADIEPLVAKNRAEFDKLATEFRQAALLSVKASESRDVKRFGEVGEALDAACENCHLRFWYPEQNELLQKAPKPGL